MAQIKTITSLATETEITFDDFYQFAWVKNLGENDCYLSAKSGIVAGAADVTLIKAGESGLIITENDTIYSKGATTLEVHAQNFAEVPFKSTATASGGGSITIDNVPTQGSTNAVSSGGTYTAIQAVKSIDYSTTEQDTGIKWIDGKTIYQKTFANDNGYTSADSIDISSLNYDKILSIEGYGADATPYADYNKWAVSAIGGHDNVYIYVKAATNELKFGSSLPIFAVTIRYTKSGA